MRNFLTKFDFSKSLEWASKMYLIYLLLFYARISHHYFFIMIALVIFYVIIDQKFILKPFFWALTILLIIPGIWKGYCFTGNHTFVTLYIAILFFIASLFVKNKKQILYINAKLMLAVMMFFAVIQKLLSTTFMDGSSLAYLNHTGSFLTHFQRFFPENQKIISANKNLIAEQIKNADGLSTTIDLTPIHWLFNFNPKLAVSFILGAELLFLAALFLKNQYLRNTYFTLFMLGLVLTRIETGFASLLCILMFLQSQKDKIEFRLIYVGLFSLFIALILSKLGYY